jgi:hypothetical protein
MRRNIPRIPLQDDSGEAAAGVHGPSILCVVPTFIEVLLTTGEKRHVEAAAGNARTEIDRWATRAKTSWIETVEGVWVNPDFVVSARLVDLPTRPAAIEA